MGWGSWVRKAPQANAAREPLGIDLNDDGDTADVGETHSGDAIPNACATIDGWFAEASVDPPNCMDFYDLANSS